MACVVVDYHRRFVCGVCTGCRSSRRSHAREDDLAAGLVALHAANFAAARTQWQPLAENGHVEAQYQLGKLFQRQEFTEASNAKSFFWLARAAAQNHPGAQAGRDALDQRMSPDERAAVRKLLQTLQSAE